MPNFQELCSVYLLCYVVILCLAGINKEDFFAGEGDWDAFWITKLNVLYQDVMNCLKFVTWKM